MNDKDVGVIGAGIVGLSTAGALLEGGASVRVYESGPPGNGQSTGEARIFRHAHDDPRLVAFAHESRKIWDEWSERLGSELVSGDGAVAIGPAVDRQLPILEAFGGIAARRIGPEELSERIPLLARYDGPAMLDEAGGAIRVRTAISALTEWIGDSLVTDDVITVRPTKSGTVEVLSVGGRSEHSQVVVCAGRGTAQLARGVGLTLPIDLAAHARVTFAVRDDAQRLACLQDSSGEFGETGTYSAAMPGNRYYSVGLSETVNAREDGSLVDQTKLAAVADRASVYAERAFPGLDPRPAEYVHCWVTHLPWSDDGFAVWRHDGLAFVAGHNLFKQAPALGRVLAQMTLGDDPDFDLRPERELGKQPQC